ncbi:MAG: hypothetical protein M3408_01720, partial [Actinomycetota bacterium]|nr:hypothetical protein [Actinomycetota bacterium]
MGPLRIFAFAVLGLVALVTTRDRLGHSAHGRSSCGQPYREQPAAGRAGPGTGPCALTWPRRKR